MGSFIFFFSLSSIMIASGRIWRLATRVARPMHRAMSSSTKTSYVRGLFCGDIHSDGIFPYPSPLEGDMKETLGAMVDPVSKYIANLDSMRIDDEQTISDEVLDELRGMGLFGLQIPTELDGIGLDNTGYARMIEIVTLDASVAVTLAAHQSIGLKGILIAGNEEQKKQYLPKLATGENMAAFALTEPSTGSDAAGIKTRAVLSEDGKHFVLNGQKVWISNGGWAEIFTVFAQTPVTNKETGETQDKITAFIVERAFGGVTNGPSMHKLGIKGSSTVELFLEDVKVPVENVLGEVGGGFKIAMQILNNGRFGMGAGATGGIKWCLEKSAEFANNRVAFGKPIAEYPLIKAKMAEMAMNCYAIESMTYMTTQLIDNNPGTDFSTEAAICKVFGSEAIWNAVDQTIQVHGGMGYMKEMHIERMMRDTRILRIFEGTNEILRLFIGLTGSQAAGKKLQAATKSASGLGTYLKGKMFAPSIANVNSSPAELRPYLQAVETESQNFARVVENLLKEHKKDIIHKQQLVERVANIAIDLYAMSAATSRCWRSLSENLDSAAHELHLTKAFCHSARARIAKNIKEIDAGPTKSGDNGLRRVGDEVLQAGKYIPGHPLGV